MRRWQQGRQKSQPPDTIKKGPAGPLGTEVGCDQRFQGVMAHLMQSSCRCSKMR